MVTNNRPTKRHAWKLSVRGATLLLGAVLIILTIIFVFTGFDLATVTGFGLVSIATVLLGK